MDARRWRAAWDAARAAKQAGVADPRLEDLARAAARELAPKETITGPLGIELVFVPGGTFKMGSDTSGSRESPPHEVTVSGFYIGRHEIAQSQYEAIMGTNPSRTKEPRLPVEQVSWNDANEFCRRLSENGGVRLRLPTEAEWEYASRGSEGRAYPWGDADPGPMHANLEGGADGHEAAAPVGSYRDGATPEGAMDMAGNVAEWCADWYGPYPSGPQENPAGPSRGKARVVRGGSFVFDASGARGAGRAGRRPDNPSETIGFRVVRELTPVELQFSRLAEGGHE